ncbi:MAG: phosphatidate cytidylyltransferase [Geodermatophilaceae bacterium]|nr:phosphatidate cytidylyltransferase [Geodermatophilaceae bacterium]
MPRVTVDQQVQMPWEASVAEADSTIGGGPIPWSPPGDITAVPSRAGRDLPVAIAVGVGLGAAIVISLIVYPPAFLAIVLAAVLISMWELSRALRTARVRPPLTPLLLGAVAMIVVTWLSGPGGLAVTTMLTVLASVVWRLSDGPVGYFRDASAAVLITVYVPLLACFAVLMLRPDDGTTRIVAFIVTVVCSDVGGYAAGVTFGRHPMSPTVSPKKSWEGFCGSVLACMIAGLLLVGVVLDSAWWQGILFGAGIAVSATLGDLGESIVKRDLGIKDMGTLLPGHGGLMDRMDSLLPSAAVAYLLLTQFVPPVLT